MNGHPAFRLTILLLACAAAAALLPGCGRPKPKPEPVAETESPPPPEDPVNTVFMRADELLTGGDTNGAVASIEAALANPELAAQRQQVFNGLIRFLLYTEQLDEARRRMREAYRGDEELARGGLGLVYGHLTERGLTDEALAWTTEILAIEGLPADVRRTFREWNLLAHVQAGHDAQVVELASQLLQEAPAGGAIGLVNRTLDALFDGGRLDTVGQVLQQAGRAVSSDAATQNLVAFSHVRLLAARHDWAALAAAFPAAAARLPDQDLQRLLRQLNPVLVKEKQSATLDSLCEEVIERQAAKTQALAFAGRLWAESAMASDKPALPVRLERLQRANLPARQLCGLYMRFFYDLIDQPAIVKPMAELGQRLAPLAEEEDARNSIRTMVLDGSFVLEDYATALRMLEEGIAGRDDAWHAMAISKVKAHRALQTGQPREAVKYFREFMVNVMSAKDEDTSDPATGVMHTKEMILGRNAKRIGDILAAIPDAEGAAKAYAEARDYYTKALAKTEENPATKEIVSREMAALPK